MTRKTRRRATGRLRRHRPNNNKINSKWQKIVHKNCAPLVPFWGNSTIENRWPPITSIPPFIRNKISQILQNRQKLILETAYKVPRLWQFCGPLENVDSNRKEIFCAQNQNFCVAQFHILETGGCHIGWTLFWRIEIEIFNIFFHECKTLCINNVIQWKWWRAHSYVDAGND